MNNKESREDYLERILMLEEKNGKVRAIDIANDMGFSKPSISIALKKLKKDNLISVSIDNIIMLTEEGRKIASMTYEKHKVISSLLIGLGVPEDIAKDDACKVEHGLSEISFQKIKEYYNKGKN